MCLHDVIGWSIFFFFKQKTAYEMRISDWSSDVCSSDPSDAKAGRAGRNLPLRVRVSGCRHLLVPPAPAQLRAGRPRSLWAFDRRRALDARSRPRPIGHAWCREIVCQYEQITVVEVSVQNKEHSHSKNSIAKTTIDDT